MYDTGLILKLILIVCLSVMGLYGFGLGLKHFFTDDIRYFKWYRKWKGGTWYFYKFNKELPNMRMFSHWTTHPFTDSESILLDKEVYKDK